MPRTMGLALALMLGSISWSAPASCPSQAEMQARLQNVKANVDARVTENEGAFELTVNIDGQVRSLRAPTCLEAADTTVFLVELVSGGTPTVRRPLSLPPGGVAELPPPPAPPSLHFMAVGGAELFLLPTPVPRFGVAIQWDLPWFRLGAEVRTAPSLNLGRPSPDSGPAQPPGVRFTSVLDAQLLACRMFSGQRLAGGLCLQGGFGVAQAVAFNVGTPTLKTFALWNLGPAMRAAIVILPNLEAQLFAVVRFGPTVNLKIDDSISVLRTNVSGLDLGAGLGVRW